MDSNCLQKAANDNARRVVQACEANWDANQSDCNAFLKAVANALGVAGIDPGADADAIILGFDANPVQWNKLVADHQGASTQAQAGSFVVAGLLSSEMGQDHGHVAVVTCGDMVQGADVIVPGGTIAYPPGYWGKLGGTGQECTGVNFAFPAPQRQTLLRYYWTNFTANPM